MAKSSQNPELKQPILATGDRILAEASPLDRVWGIGLHGTDPRAQDRSQWQGSSLLGSILMRVRAELAAHPD